MTVNEYLDIVRRWLLLADPYPLLAMLGALAGHLLPGEPVWLALLGAPSIGKTTLLDAALALNRVEALSDLTVAGLLTNPGHRRRGTGGVLNRLGPEGGVIAIFDLSWLLAAHARSDDRLVPMLREVHDGMVRRSLGGDHGAILEWPGEGRRARVSLLAGGTGDVDEHAVLLNAMGPRLVFARMPAVDRLGIIAQASTNEGRGDAMRAEIKAATVELFAGLDAGRAGERGVLDEGVRDLVDFVAVARSPVLRRGREITLVTEPEVGVRLYLAITQIRRGLLALGVEPTLGDQVAYRIGVDSIPAKHHSVIAWLAQPGIHASITHNVASGLDYQDGPIRDVLEELAARRVVIRHEGTSERDDTWSLAHWARQRWDAITSWLPAEPPATSGPVSAETAEPRPYAKPVDDEDPELDALDRERRIGRYRTKEQP